MYFPYLRGRQYELLALKELVARGLIHDQVVPIVEPVKMSPTLLSTLDEFDKRGCPVAVIRNPKVGSFNFEISDSSKRDASNVMLQKWNFVIRRSTFLHSVIMDRESDDVFTQLESEGVDKHGCLVVLNDRESLSSYETVFANSKPRYVLIPDESAFRRRVEKPRVVLSDHFCKKDRNSDYIKCQTEFFSDEHLYYKDDGYIGFSDYSIVGDNYMDAGFAPYAIAIHIVFFDVDGSLKIQHFVSDDNEDISNPAMKFYQAVGKLHKWVVSNKSLVGMTFGLQSFLDLYKSQSYPGLGSLKKLSIMHHIELMDQYLEKVK